MGGSGGEPPRLKLGRLALIGAAAIAFTVAVGAVGAQIAERSADDDGAMAMQQDGSFDRAFIDAMVPHHRSAIEMARTAQHGLTDPTLKKIAADITSTQQREIDRMLAWRQEWYGSRTLDPNAGHELGLSMEEMGMAGDAHELHDAADVDAGFAAMMVDHHEGAIRMAELALDRGQHPEIRTLARQIVAAQQREVQLMRPLAAHT
jgi:uncharacterized protein (DUF305 family)